MIKVLARHVLVIVSPYITGRPWMAQTARRTLRRLPALRLRIHRLLAPVAAIAPPESSLLPHEAAVLVDLREALMDRRGAAK